MDVNYLVATHIASHLPRELRYVDPKTAKFYDSRHLVYSMGIYVWVKRIPLDIIKTLRLVHSTFANMYDIFDLYHKRHVYLFRTQYSAIMLRNHVFDMRWVAFPVDQSSQIYADWKAHDSIHLVCLYHRSPTRCSYCDVEYQELIDTIRKRPHCDNALELDDEYVYENTVNVDMPRDETKSQPELSMYILNCIDNWETCPSVDMYDLMYRTYIQQYANNAI